MACEYSLSMIGGAPIRVRERLRNKSRNLRFKVPVEGISRLIASGGSSYKND